MPFFKASVAEEEEVRGLLPLVFTLFPWFILLLLGQAWAKGKGEPRRASCGLTEADVGQWTRAGPCVHCLAYTRCTGFVDG